jgi:16S rRNA (cytosine967-C5)-methyltransferase
LNDQRLIALRILDAYFRKKGRLKPIINKHLLKHQLSATERRFIYNIVKGTIRYLLKIDYLTSLFLEKKLTRLNPSILNILRLSVFQILYLDHVPSYSIVNEATNTAKKLNLGKYDKLVNAVLRKITAIEDINSFLDNKISSLSDERKRIKLSYSFPYWLIKYWNETYPIEKVKKIAEYLNEKHWTYIRFDPQKVKKSEVLEILSAQGFKDSKHDLIIENALGLSSSQDLSETNIFKQGRITIQDLSSQIAVEFFLDPKTDENILDLCSAPGGKAAIIAQKIGPDRKIIAVDHDEKRMGMLKANMDRLQIKSIIPILADAAVPDFLSKEYYGYFDKIFIDSPCSGFGTLFKNPEAKYNRIPDDIKMYADLSQKILANAHPYLKVGGKIVFYTCTISPMENQEVIQKFMEDHDYYYDLSPTQKLEEAGVPFEEGMHKEYFEIMPYYFDSEGGFAASMIKR